MSFDDLPPNWTELPLSTPNMAGNVVDLVLSESLRAENSLLLLPCDAAGVGYPTPVVLGDTDWFADEGQRAQMLHTLAEIAVPSVVVAASSPRRLPAEVLERWCADAQAAFAAADTWVIGFFCAWADHVNEVMPAELGHLGPQRGSR
ncbi:MAG: hypothetical protein ACTHWO_08910 [Nesterenkonia sp.]